MGKLLPAKIPPGTAKVLDVAIGGRFDILPDRSSRTSGSEKSAVRSSQDDRVVKTSLADASLRFKIPLDR